MVTIYCQFLFLDGGGGWRGGGAVFNIFYEVVSMKPYKEPRNIAVRKNGAM